MICFMSNQGTVDGGDLKYEKGEKKKKKESYCRVAVPAIRLCPTHYHTSLQ